MFLLAVRFWLLQLKLLVAFCWNAADFDSFGQLMHMELDRLNREVDVKFTRQDALEMRKVWGGNDER